MECRVGSKYVFVLFEYRNFYLDWKSQKGTYFYLIFGLYLKSIYNNKNTHKNYQQKAKHCLIYDWLKSQGIVFFTPVVGLKVDVQQFRTLN